MKIQASQALQTSPTFSRKPNEYDAFLAHIRSSFLANVQNDDTPLFTTDTQDLYAAYLDALPPEQRQYNTCIQCSRFLNGYGGLVTIDANGFILPAMWNEANAPASYRQIIAVLARLVRKSRVTGVFLSSEAELGKSQTGKWHHMAVTQPTAMIFKHPILSANQMWSEKHEDFSTVRYALDIYKLSTLKTALTLLQTDSLYRSEKVLGAAQWLYNLQEKVTAAQSQAIRNNIIWRAIATAPAGFCHPRSSMIGTLLDDITTGMSFQLVSQRFATKMNPTQYLRPQAAPSEGTIIQAEKIMAQLQAENALARRFARVDELKAIWRPTTNKRSSAPKGIFGHLITKAATLASANMNVPTVTMTWHKFSRTVLPTAERIELYTPATKRSYAALVTAVNTAAPPIFQWDHADARNPVSWYVWVDGSVPQDFCLAADQFHDIAAITFKPSMWGGEDQCPNQSQGVIFIMAGARETKQSGVAIFPECLKAEFHGIRSVIEAYSRNATIAGMNEPHACGLLLSNGGTWETLFRVTTKGVTATYRLDRWD